MSEWKLGDFVWIVMQEDNATPPCPECGLSKINKEIKVFNAEISDIYSHESVEGTNYRYRVRVNDEVIETMWIGFHGIFSTEEEAEAKMKEIKENRIL